jgi:Carbohydrate family 9 binding domain-like
MAYSAVRFLFPWSCAVAAALALVIHAPVLDAMSSASPSPQQTASAPASSARPEIRVRAVEDFAVNGRGDNPAWNGVEWTTLNARNNAKDPYPTKFKVLYSKKGLYVLMDAVDKKLTATFRKDFENLWTEDVFEVFLWTDERDTVYFEYEISPLNYELPIIIPNFEGTFLGWLPWHYDGERKIQKAVSVTGGKQESGAAVESWRAEFMIPYDLLRPLRNAVPAKGTKWRANFYRIDHDRGKDQAVQWAWSPVQKNFHDFRNFGTLIFE